MASVPMLKPATPTFLNYSESHVSDGDGISLEKEQYPLHRAAQEGRCIALTKLLESQQYDVNEANFQLVRPLHGACLSGNFECADLLIRYGADTTQHVLNFSLSMELISGSLQRFYENMELTHMQWRARQQIISSNSPCKDSCLTGREHPSPYAFTADSKSDVSLEQNDFSRLPNSSYPSC